jgi:uncharacterized damage-inducible protein DinB
MSLFRQTLVARGILSGEQEHRQEEFHMKKILIQYGGFALAIALMVPLAQAQKAVTGLSDNDLQAPVKLFGEDMTKQGALMPILEDQHEHLGQSIAYARSNGVVPPWSK